MNSKRKAVEELIYKIISILDPSELNTKKYKESFKQLNDKQFDTFIKNFLNDESENFYLEVLPFENEPTMANIKKAAEVLKVPLEEYIYYRHDGSKNEPIRSKMKVPIGYVNLKRLQQVLSKKNSYSLDIDKRDMKTGQVVGDSKVARISNMENYALNVIGADNALKEFMGPRADNSKKKLQMYQDIADQGYVQLSNLSSDIEDSQTVSTIDVYFTGAGVITDLLTPTYMLPRTIKNKELKEKTYQKNDRMIKRD